MQYLIIAAGVVIAIGYACMMALQGLVAVVDSISDSRKQAKAKRAEKLAKSQYQKQQALAASEQAELDAYRQDNPARIVDIPNAEAFKRVFQILDDFTAAANSFRLQRVFNNRNIENLFRDFASIKFFLARDNVREVLVVR